MAKKIIISTVFLTLSLSSNHLQASSLDFVNSFTEKAPHQSLARPGNRQNRKPNSLPGVRRGDSSFCSTRLLPDKKEALETIFLEQPAALSEDLELLIEKVPAFALTRRHSSHQGKFSQQVVLFAYEQLHTPYQRGGSLQTGRSTDCSGFVRYVYQNFQIDLPRSSAQQAQRGKVASRRMDFSKLAVGDLLFFRESQRSINHVGLYVGNGKMIHASARRRRVTLSDLREPHYSHTFVVAKRFLDQP